MGFSKLAIFNMAIAELPDARIDSVDEASLAAECCRDNYQQAVQMLVEDHAYDFAVVRTVLSPAENDRGGEWDYAYTLPSDMARPVNMLPFSADDASAGAWRFYGPGRSFESAAPYRIAAGKLYANSEKAVLEYVTNRPDESHFTAMFARAVALELAARIVMPVKKDQKRQDALIRFAEIARERAKAADMNRDRESTNDFTPEAFLARSVPYGCMR